MKRFSNIIISIAILLSLSVAVKIVHADPPVNLPPSQESTLDKGTYTLLAPIGDFKEIQTDGTGTCPGNPEMKSGLGCYLNILFKIGIGVCGAIAVIMIVIGGIQLMGNESVFGKVEAKQKIFQALFGLLIALGAFALLNTIDPNLTGRNGVKVDQVSAVISPEDTSTGSQTVSSSGSSLCLPANPTNPNSATGSTLNLNNTMNNKYIPARDALGITTGVKLLITAQAAVEGFSATPAPGTKSYRTNNPGNIGNVDNGGTKSFPTLADGIAKQRDIISNIAANKSPSYKIGSKPTCALGTETYNGYLYQYLRIYATGARFTNNYLNAIIGYFSANGKTITAKTTMSEIYSMQ